MASLYFNGIRSVFFTVPSLRDVISISDTSPIEPSYGTSLEWNSSRLVRSFGDGYEQVNPDGINTDRLRLSLQFSKRSYLIVTELTKFFRGRNASALYDRDPLEWFWLIPPTPWDDDGTYLKFRMADQSFRTQYHGYNSTSVNVEVYQVYEP